MADLVMRKRPAMHAGEVGLFIDSQVFEDDFAHIKTGTDIEVKATQSRNLKQMRLGWAIAAKVAESGVLGDADRREVMDWILMRCKHVRYVTNRHRDGVETIPVVKSIRFAAMDGTEFNRLFNRMIYIVQSEILPDMPEGDLRAEVEKMAGVSTPESEDKPKAAPKRRQRATAPKPVSVIPVDDTPPGAPADDTPSSPSASAAPAPSSSPAAIGDRAAPASGPATMDVRGWQDYCFEWLKAVDDDDEKADIDVLKKWSGETKLRNSCGVTSDDRQKLFEYMNAILEKKREAQAKRV